MDVIFLAPSYPPEMQQYTRGLAEVGARVFGVGDAPERALPEEVRDHLAGYLQVRGMLDEDDVVSRVVQWTGGRRPDRVEALWEPLVTTAARLREALGVPGMSLSAAMGFRDKQLMKERVAAAGLRVPRSARCADVLGVRRAVAEIGYPVCIKPIAGAGSADTYRVDTPEELDVVLGRLVRIAQVSVEEFVEGEEFTYDTVCIDGVPAFENVCQYLPRPLEARTKEWLSPIVCTVRDLEQPRLADGIALGRRVLRALGMGTGFTHMEWFRKADGEVVFGEIGCRPGGAHLVDQMNLTCDIDLFREWARAVCWGRFEGDTTRRYNAAIVFKRARGQGRIARIDGLDTFVERFRPSICWEQLLPVGTPRRDWRKTLLSDGFVIVRDPDWERALEIARHAADDITMYAT